MAKKFRMLSIVVIALITEYIICSYMALNLFNNLDVTKYLFVLCLFIAGISVIFNKNTIAICIVSGYMVSFLMGVLCNVEFNDSHETIQSTWYVWFVCGIGTMLIVGVILEIFAVLREKSSANKSNMP